MTSLDQLLCLHLDDPFPPSITKGQDYGEVDAVMIGADIYGWGFRARDGVLEHAALERLGRARDALVRSLDDLPTDAVPYYQRLIEIAGLALDACRE